MSDVLPKIKRNLASPEAREFWRQVDEAEKEVAAWPSWRSAGIVVELPKSEPEGSSK